MDFTCSSLKIETRRTNCAVVAVHEGRRLDDDGKRADAACGKLLSQILRRGDISGKVGETPRRDASALRDGSGGDRRGDRNTPHRSREKHTAPCETTRRTTAVGKCVLNEMNRGGTMG